MRRRRRSSRRCSQEPHSLSDFFTLLSVGRRPLVSFRGSHECAEGSMDPCDRAAARDEVPLFGLREDSMVIVPVEMVQNGDGDR